MENKFNSFKDEDSELVIKLINEGKIKEAVEIVRNLKNKKFIVDINSLPKDFNFTVWEKYFNESEINFKSK